MTATPHAHDRSDLPPPRTEEVAPGVLAYVQPDGSWFLNNCGFVVAEDHVVAIDATSTEARTRSLLGAIRDVAGDRPVRTLVNTHAHGDHTHGNRFFLPGATIVGHERCRASILEGGLMLPLIDGIFPGVEWGDLEAAPPVLTFTDSVTLWVGEFEVQLIHLGPAHTDNDVVAWLPGPAVLFAGDLCFNGGHPNNVGGSIAGTIAAVDALATLSPRVIVPGHGAVCGTEVLADMREYMQLVQRVAADAVASGLSPLEAARQADTGRFAAWLDSERLAGNLHRAMAEATGGDVDVAAAFGDMMALNGGPLRCLA